MAKRLFIFLSGGVVNISSLKFNNKDILICADGGIKRILSKSIKSKVFFLGDFDSVNKHSIKNIDVEVMEFPKDKDMTDGHLAIDYACTNFNKSIQKVIVGGLTDRLDHTLGNILATVPYVKKGHSFEVWGNRIKLYLTSKSIAIKTKINHKISLIALERVFKATTKGLKWKLNKEVINPYNSRTLRNEAESESVTIDLKKGVLMIAETW